MEKQLQAFTQDEIFFLSAVKNEVFNRIFPTIRHDLVAHVSASLIRLSIMDRILKKDNLDPDKVKLEFQKIDELLRNNIVDIRQLAFWDFSNREEDYTFNILVKSVQLISSQLAFKGIQLNVKPKDSEIDEKVEAKALLFTLICIFCYLEDNDFDNCICTLTHSSNFIKIQYDCKSEANSKVITNDRHLKITQEIAVRFAKLQLMDIVFFNQEIKINWK